MTVFVVARAHHSGRFDCFYTKQRTDDAYREELLNVKAREKDNRTACLFEVDTERTTPDDITREIDDGMIELCAAATVKEGPL
jgi:hypothetical protein